MGSLLSLSFFFFIVQLSSVVNGRNFSGSLVTPIKHDLYHSSGSLLEQVTALAGRHPDRLSMEKIKAQNKGYSAEILVVTYSHVKSEIEESSKFRILLTFGQHGRELITSEVAFRLLTIISGEHGLHNMGPNSLNAMLDKFVIKVSVNMADITFLYWGSEPVSSYQLVKLWVVPMENLNGRKLVEAGDLCERRNGRGVDLNRNWSIDWGKKEKDFNPYEENPGTAPFSEPETQIMRKLSKSFTPHVWVNVHSGMEALFMPYDHRNSTPNGLATDVMRSMLEELNHHHCHDRCLVGSGGGSVGYLAHGTSTDYMYDVVNVPLAFTFEIYGDLEASSRDCFKMFNPVDVDTFNRVLNDWCGAFFMIFEIGPNWLDKVHSQVHVNQSRLVSMNSYLDPKFKGRREGSSHEVLDIGMQELRTYFRLFLLSSVLLLFMFCSRISKSKYITVT